MRWLTRILALTAIGCAHEPAATPTATASSPPPSASSTSASAGSASSATPTSSASASEAPSTPAAPPSKTCSGSLPKDEMFRDNIADTELSGLAEIVKASRTSTDGKVPAPTTGYVHFRYEVRVVKWFHGAQPSERIVLTQGAEASSTELPPGNLLFFSACKSNDGGWEPDVGYFFPIEDACRAKVEGIGEAAAKRVHSGGKRKARACTPPKK